MAVKKETKKDEVMKEKKEPITVSRKTVIVICAVLIAILLLALYLYKWRDVKTQESLMNSYLLSTDTVSLEIKNLDEVPQILTEAPNDYFVLITYTGDKETQKLEKGLKEIIDKYKLSDYFYYLNIESMKKEDNYLTRLNNAFNTNKITTTPIILYFKDGKLIDTVTRVDNNPINAGDFQKLLDIYEFEGQ